MLLRNMRLTAAASALALAMTAGAALAHGPSEGRGGYGMGGYGMMGGGMMGGGMMGGGGPMGYHSDFMLDRVDGRLAYLKTELHITDAQDAAWNDFAKAVRAMAERHNKRMHEMMDQFDDDDDFAAIPLPKRMAYYEKHVEAQLAEVKGVTAATEKLYAVLDDNQQHTADEIVMPMMGMGMGGMGMGAMGMGRMFGPGATR